MDTEMRMNTEFFECQCGHSEHILRFTLDQDDGDVYTNVFLGDYTLTKRIWNAIKYIFGYKCRYGYFDCTLLRPEDYDRLISLLNKSKAIKEQENDQKIISQKT